MFMTGGTNTAITCLSGNLEIAGSKFRSNGLAIDIGNCGDVTITDAEFTNNGYAICINTDFTQTLTITGSTFANSSDHKPADHSISGGRALSLIGDKSAYTVSITDSIFSDLSTDADGGALYFYNTYLYSTSNRTQINGSSLSAATAAYSASSMAA